MINNVRANIVGKNILSDFHKPETAYWLGSTSEENKSQKSKHSLAATVLISSLCAGLGILTLASGILPKNATKFLSNLKFKLEQKLAENSKFKNFYRYILNKTESFIGKFQSINNITSLKDVLFKRLMYGQNGRRTFTRKIHNGITKFFDKISRKTVNSSYANADSKFASLSEHLSSINERLLKQNPTDSKIRTAIETINMRVRKVNTSLNDGFGISARTERLEDLRRSTDGLFDYIWNASFSDVKNFKSKNMWQSFIAEDYMQPAKMELANKVAALRRMITHDISDTYKATSKAVEDIQKFINPKDNATNEILNNIRINLKKYKKLSGKDEIAQRTQLNSEIIENLKNLNESFSEMAGSYHYNEEAVSAVSKYITNVESLISSSSKGELQEILTLYKEILPRKEYLKLKLKVQDAINSLDDAINKETNKYFDKVRDLKLGSAPTDVLSIIGGVGAVGYYLGKSKDNDERISAALKAGIPAIGTIATSLYCTARLISGGKSLALGLLSGAIINRIGTYLDDARKKYALDVKFHKRETKNQTNNV